MENKLTISFSNKREIRMGSPYMMAELNIKGLDFEIPNACWQDKYAISTDKKIIALIGFELTGNEPGFKIYIIDTQKKTTTITKRIVGLVNKISVEERKIKFNKFIYNKQKSKAGELCCNIDDEYDIK